MRRHGNKSAAKYRSRYQKATEELARIERIELGSRKRAIRRYLNARHDEPYKRKVYIKDFLESLNPDDVMHGTEVDTAALQRRVDAYNRENPQARVWANPFQYSCNFLYPDSGLDIE